MTGVFETLDAVGAGVLQAHSSWPGYFSGKDAGLAVISDFVFGYQHPHQAEAWFQHRGGLQMLREAYAKYNVYPIGVSWWGVESIVSKKPIQKMEDFKGVKFRSPQGMTAEILTKLGASIVVLPGGEVFSALDKGVVDAADWATISMNERMGFHGVAKYPTKVFHSMPVQEFSVNIAAWKALPDDIKGILQFDHREWTWDQVQRVAVDDVRVLKELSGKGVKHEIWDDAQMVKMRELAHEDLGRLVEEDTARQAGLRLPARLAQGSGRRCMTDAGGRQGAVRRDAPPIRAGSLLRCASIGINTWVARFWGASIICSSRSPSSTRWWRAAGSGRRPSGPTRRRSTCRPWPTCWAAAMPCCGADTFASTSSTGCWRRLRRRAADVFSFVFFSLYVGALIWVGTQMAWSSFLQSEGTGTPWNPPIWPVKMAIPIAGLLLLLQGIVNLLRELGVVPEAEPPA